MNIIDVYFGKSEIFCGVHLKTASKLPLVVFNLTFGHSLIVKEFFACMWLEIWDGLHTPNARWLAIMVCTFWQEKLWKCLTIEWCPSSGSQKHSTHFPCKFDWSNISFGGSNMALSCASLPSNVII